MRPRSSQIVARVRVGEQALVVADERQRRAAHGKARLQPLDRNEIEVIGGLVQEQDVGLRAQGPDQRGPPRLAAGKPGRISGRIDPELGHHRPRRIRVVKLAKPAST